MSPRRSVLAPRLPLLVILLVSVLPLPLESQEGTVLVTPSGEARALTAQELADLAQKPPTGTAAWRWSEEAAPQRWPEVGDLERGPLRSKDRLTVIVVAGAAGVEGRRRAAEVIAAPVALWEEVPETLLPRWPVVWPEPRADRPAEPGIANLPTDRTVPWRLRLVGEEGGSTWQELPAMKTRATLHRLPAEDLRLSLEMALSSTGEGPGSGEETAQPVPGARVLVREGATTRDLSEQRTYLVSDQQGQVRLPALPQGQGVTLTVEAEGFAPTVWRGSARQLSGTVRLAPGVGVTGRMVDGEGEAVAGVTVTASTWLAPDIPEVLRREGVSGEDGRFSLGNLPAGQIAVQGEAPGMAVPGTTVEVTTGVADVGDLVVTADAGVTVLVTDPRENPIAGAAVNAEGREAETDHRGRVTLRGLPTRGGLRLFATAPGYVRGMQLLRLPASEAVHIVLQPAFTVSGRLLDEDGVPIPEGTVRGRIRSLGQGAVSQGNSADLAADGTFQIPLTPNGEGSLTLSSPRTVDLKVPVTTGEPGGTADLGDLTAPAGATVVGRVVDGQDGSPLAGARIWAPQGRRENALMHWLRGQVHSAVSDAEGRFELEGIPPGAELDLRIERAGYARAHAMARPTEEEPRVDLRDLHLHPGATVEVRFEGDSEPAAVARVDLRGEGLELDQLTAPLREGVAVVEHVPPGPVQVWVRRGMEELCEASATVPEEGEITVPCRRGGVRVEGQVRVGDAPAGPGILGWSSAASLSGPRVVTTRSGPGGLLQAQSFGAGTQPFMVEVDESGRFTVESVKAGRWDVSWSPQKARQSDTYQPGTHQSITVEIPTADFHRLDLDYGGGAIRGTVIDPEGAPIAGAWVAIREGGSSTRSAEDGTFTLPIADGTERLTVQARKVEEGLFSEAVSVDPAASEPLTLVLDRGPREIVARILGPDGLPAAGALAFLDAGEGRLRLTTADAGGVASWRLTPPHPPRLRIAAQAAGTWGLGTWRPLEEVEEIRLEVEEGGSLRVSTDQAADPPGGLQILGPEGWDVAALLNRTGTRLQVTPEAPLLLPGLPPGVYTLAPTRGAGLPVQATVRAGGEVEVRLE